MPPSSKTKKRTVERILDRLAKHNGAIMTISQCEMIGIKMVSIKLEDLSTSAPGPRYFRAIPREWFAQHPIRRDYYQSVKRRTPHLLLLDEYDAEVASKSGPDATIDELLAAEPQARVQQIEMILNHHIWQALRADMPKGQGVLVEAREWSYANLEDSPTLSEIYLGYKPLGHRSEHPLSALYEVDDQRLPHVTMVVQHYSEEEAGEGIRTHELAYILLAMQVRYSQPEFSEYETIPVLLLSFMTPQHGRIMEAYLEGTQLILGVSRMYSFKTNHEAPFELFESWLLGDPVGLTSAHETAPAAGGVFDIARDMSTSMSRGSGSVAGVDKENKRPLRSRSIDSGRHKKSRK